MKPRVHIAAPLVVGGLFAILFPSFFDTSTDKVVDLGPLHATADTSRIIPLPLLLGSLALLAGLYLIAKGRRRR